MASCIHPFFHGSNIALLSSHSLHENSSSNILRINYTLNALSRVTQYASPNTLSRVTLEIGTVFATKMISSRCTSPLANTIKKYAAVALDAACLTYFMATPMGGAALAGYALVGLVHFTAPEKIEGPTQIAVDALGVATLFSGVSLAGLSALFSSALRISLFALRTIAPNQSRQNNGQPPQIEANPQREEEARLLSNGDNETAALTSSTLQALRRSRQEEEVATRFKTQTMSTLRRMRDPMRELCTEVPALASQTYRDEFQTGESEVRIYDRESILEHMRALTNGALDLVEEIARFCARSNKIHDAQDAIEDHS